MNDRFEVSVAGTNWIVVRRARPGHPKAPSWALKLAAVVFALAGMAGAIAGMWQSLASVASSVLCWLTAMQVDRGPAEGPDARVFTMTEPRRALVGPSLVAFEHAAAATGLGFGDVCRDLDNPTDEAVEKWVEIREAHGDEPDGTVLV